MSPNANKQRQDKLMLILHLERTAPLVQPSAAARHPSRVRSAAGALAALFTVRTSNRMKALAGIAVLLAAAGCSGGDSGRLPVFPVQGEVLVGDKPAAGAFVVLHPKGEVQGDIVRPRGYVRADGSFELSSYDSNDGAPQGEYHVTIELRDLQQSGKDAWAGPNTLPVQYSRPATSPIAVSVARGSNRLPPIVIQQ